MQRGNMARVLTRRNYIKKIYILPWFEAQLPIGFEYKPRGFGHFGLIFDQNLPSFEDGVVVRIELRGEKDVLDLCPRYFDDVLQVL